MERGRKEMRRESSRPMRSGGAREEREWPEMEKRRNEPRREGSRHRRSGGARQETREETQAFLDLKTVTNVVREEIKNAFQAFQTLHTAGANGSGAVLTPRPSVGPGISSWVEMLTRLSNTN